MADGRGTALVQTDASPEVWCEEIANQGAAQYRQQHTHEDEHKVSADKDSQNPQGESFHSHRVLSLPQYTHTTEGYWVCGKR